MIPRRNLSLLSNRLARPGGRRLPEAVLESDYCIAWFLVGLAASPVRDVLVFKGGTALKRCYFGDYGFSEEMDFTLLQEIPLDRILTGLRALCGEVERQSGVVIRLAREDSEPHPSTHMFYLGYEGPLSGGGKEIKVDISCGDVDPFVPPYLMDQTGLSMEEIKRMLTKNGGLLGISGVSGDVRDLELAAAKGEARAQLALDVFAYAVKKYIGAYAAAMGGLDVIAFSGGIGENGIEMRREICRGLEFLDVEIDEHRNQVRKTEAIISKEGARVAVVVVPTDEEIVAARETARVIGEIDQ